MNFEIKDLQIRYIIQFEKVIVKPLNLEPFTFLKTSYILNYFQWRVKHFLIIHFQKRIILDYNLDIILILLFKIG